MNEYKNPETMKSVIDHIEEGGDAVFREVFRNRLWVPIVAHRCGLRSCDVPVHHR